MKINYAEISSNNIKKLAQETGLSITQLAEVVGIPQTSLNASLKSKKGAPIEHLIKIADFFKTTVPALCGKTEKPEVSSNLSQLLNSELTNLNSTEMKIVKTYRVFNKEGKRKLWETIDDMLQLKKYTESEISDEFYNKKAV